MGEVGGGLSNIGMPVKTKENIGILVKYLKISDIKNFEIIRISVKKHSNIGLSE